MATEAILLTGNEALARGAIRAGCKYFFGYPITPQSDIPEYMSRELPKIGGAYVQSESETASIYMVYGGALAGARVMTSTSSPGFSLMQEGISYMAEAETPCVIVNVSRLGPGIGTGGQAGQTDYHQVTKGGGHGAYRCIVLAPASSQECFDLIQLGFHLAEKHRNPVIVLSDSIVGQTAEPVQMRVLPLEPPEPRAFALNGKDKKAGKRCVHTAGFLTHGSVVAFHTAMKEKLDRMRAAEVRFEARETDNAELLLVAYGSTARFCKGASEVVRAKGIRAGVFRPVSLWPFPEDELRRAAEGVRSVLVVEDGPGELVEDVQNALRHHLPVHLLGIWARHNPGPSGVIYPERIAEEVEKICGNID